MRLDRLPQVVASRRARTLRLDGVQFPDLAGFTLVSSLATVEAVPVRWRKLDPAGRHPDSRAVAMKIPPLASLSRSAIPRTVPASQRPIAPIARARPAGARPA